MSQFRCRRPVLVVEGEGDLEAVPRLVRDIAARLELFDIAPAPNPKKIRSLSVLRRDLEKWVEYVWLEPAADSALFLVDCEDDCPVEVVRDDLLPRLSAMMQRPQARPVGIVLAHREFETLFLTSLPSIVQCYPELGWKPDDVAAWADKDVTSNRGAKEQLTTLMKKGRIYRETEHQVRFVGAMDWDAARRRCRWYRHFEQTLLWLAGRHESTSMTYPVLAS